MGPCGRCWGHKQTCIMEMGDEGMCVGHEKCSQCGGTGIEPPPMVLVFDWDAPQWREDALADEAHDRFDDWDI
jgi:hypothetical protein